MVKRDSFTAGDIYKLVGPEPTSKRILQVAAMIVREKDTEIVRHNIFTLQYYMGTVADAWKWGAMAQAYRDVLGTTKN